MWSIESGLIVFYFVSLGYERFPTVLSSFTEFYRVLQRLYQAQLDFEPVLPGFTISLPTFMEDTGRWLSFYRSYWVSLLLTLIIYWLRRTLVPIGQRYRALPGFGWRRFNNSWQEKRPKGFFFILFFLPFLLLFFWSARNSWSTFGRRGPCGEHNRSITARYRLLSRFDIRWATRFDGAPILFVFFFNCCVFFPSIETSYHLRWVAVFIFSSPTEKKATDGRRVAINERDSLVKSGAPEEDRKYRFTGFSVIDSRTLREFPLPTGPAIGLLLFLFLFFFWVGKSK